MPPRKATQAASQTAISSMPATTSTLEQTHTPEQSPSKSVAGITQAQKQALVDNLQLEITERARKLRGQYALQAQGLRVRLEMRVNRIPQALRKRKMQDLLDEHAERANPKPASAIAVHHEQLQTADEPVRKTLKRQSDQISTSDDKENVPSSQATQQDLPMPKKRAKTAVSTTTTATANTKAARGKPAAPPAVLSPKSHNSRTLPRSPFKTSPEKPAAARPASPIKATGPVIPKRTTSRPQAKRAAPGARSEDDTSRTSEASNTSAGTTIVTTTKAGAAKGGRVAAAAKKVTAAAKGAAAGAKKSAATTKAKKENVPPAAATGRALRKRA